MTATYSPDAATILTPSTALKGLRLSVFRNAEFPGDHSNGGLTAHHIRLTVVGIVDVTIGDEFTPVPAWQIFDHTDYAPPVVAVVRHRLNSSSLYAWLEPVTITDSGQIVRLPGRLQFGGSLAATLDSRFGQILESRLGYPGIGALKIHDRRA